MADVAVIIPCFNAQDFIGQTIESVLAQTHLPREVVIVDDGSTDASASLVARYVDQSGGRVRLIRQSNAGESRARNVAIEASTSPFIAFLDADDLWLPQKTASQLERLTRQDELVGVYTRIFNFESQIDDRQREETERTKDQPTVEDLVSYHYVAPSSLMVRRQTLIERQIRFDEAVHHSEDMLYIAELRLAGPIGLVDQPLVAKRVHATQQSRSPWHPIWSYQSRAKWCRQRRELLRAERYNSVMEELGQRMVAVLEDRYWRRQLTGYRKARRIVASLFPNLLGQSAVANRIIYPKWVYGVRDSLVAGKRR